MPTECEPLAFLEKSHCVPILLALDTSGMMNRNQLYKELNESIKVVIKRIEFLIECDLIFEETMKVRPKAKYIGLTEKGRTIASKLWEIKTEMEKSGPGFASHFFGHLDPVQVEDTFVTGLFEKPVVVRNLKKELEDLIACPNCGKERYMFKIKGKETWLCFWCGTKTEATPEDEANLYAIERLIRGT